MPKLSNPLCCLSVPALSVILTARYLSRKWKNLTFSQFLVNSLSHLEHTKKSSCGFSLLPRRLDHVFGRGPDFLHYFEFCFILSVFLRVEFLWWFWLFLIFLQFWVCPSWHLEHVIKCSWQFQFLYKKIDHIIKPPKSFKINKNLLKVIKIGGHILYRNRFVGPHTLVIFGGLNA